MKSRNSWYNGWPFLLIFSWILLISIFTIVTKPIYGDEGWFYCAAWAKNFYGYFTFPPFYDIPAFNHTIMFDSVYRIVIHLYRMSIFVFSNPIYSIVLVRLLIFIVFILSLLYYLKKQEAVWKGIDQLLLFGIVILNPIVFNNFITGREDAILSSIVIIIVAKLSLSQKLDDSWIWVVVISVLGFYLHPNGIIFLLIIGFLSISYKKSFITLKLWIFLASSILFYYLVFIDYNFPAFKLQSLIVNASGNEEKFITSFSDIGNYIYNEIVYRYLVLNKGVKIYYLLFLISGIVPIILSILFLLRNKNTYYYHRVYIFSLMIFFIFLGEKTSQYLYFLPISIIISSYFLQNKKSIFRLISLVLISLFSIFHINTIANSLNFRESVQSKILNVVNDKVEAGSSIYTSLNFGVYLIKDYNFFETTQKLENDLFSLYDIKLRDCIVIETYDSPIWEHVCSARDTLLIVDKFLIVSVD